MTPSRLRPSRLPIVLVLMSATALGGPVSFQNDVMPIFMARCVMCHVEGAELGNLRLYPDAWAQLVGVPSKESPLRRIEAGAADKSYLYLKVQGTQLKASGSGARMPFQQDPLTTAELALLRKWIEEGAQRN